MADGRISSKHIQIDKAKLHIIIAVSVAVFLLVFTLVASKALLEQRSYQSKLISKKQVASATLDENLKNIDVLKQSYERFTTTTQNAIGGNPTGEGERDGDNARLVLDALPSKYDFPALATSLDKIFESRNYPVESITGTDDEVAQAANQTSATPTPIEVPFEVQVVVNAGSLQDVLTILERSIRPIQLKSLAFTGTDSSLKVTINANTFYQPEKLYEVKKEAIQ